MIKQSRLHLLLPILLILLLLISISVSAADTTGTLSTGQTWNFDSATGTLTITGEGGLPDFPYQTITPENMTPWKPWAKEIKTVVLSEGITNTGKYTFFKLENLTHVQLPSTLQIIDSYAFSSTAISAITIPDSLTTLGECAFSRCKALKELRFPASLTEMGDHIFDYCTSYAKIYFYGDLPNTPGMHYTGSHINIMYPKGNETWAEENLPSWDGDIVILPFSDCSNEHTYGGWINIVEPTQDTEGQKERVCVICKHKDYATVPKLGNNSPATTPSTTPTTQPPTTAPATQPSTTAPPATQPSTSEPTSEPNSEPTSEPTGTEQTQPAQTEATTPASPSKAPESNSNTVIIVVSIVLGVGIVGGAVWYFLRKRK